MQKTTVPLFYYGTERAIARFGRTLEKIAQQAYREIGQIANGHDVQHHQFRTTSGVLVAVASRRRKSGMTEIEIDLVTARLPERTYLAQDKDQKPSDDSRMALPKRA
jgi:hypothetical protein